MTTRADDPPSRPRVLAGAPALDRRVFPRPGSVPRWFEPFHVRQPRVARGEVAAQVAIGADIVVAPAWLTHHRALETVGESRRAVEWTRGAVRLVREAVEAGIERRDGSSDTPVLVAGPLPDVSARPEHATGRLPSAALAEERDVHDQAGILMDAAVDLILLESRPSFEAAARSTRIVAGTGVGVWTTLGLAGSPDEPPLAERVAGLVASGATGVLIEIDEAADPRTVTDDVARVAAGTTVSLGLVAVAPPVAGDDVLDAWLGAGAAILGVASGADPTSLRPLVEARERRLLRTRERLDGERAALLRWALAAAHRAPGGRALWLGARVIDPPAGFDWTVLDAVDLMAVALPEEAFRLVVVVTDVEPDRVVRLVEHGGILAVQTSASDGADLLVRLGAEGLRVQQVDPAPDGSARIILRREDP